jgi:hypothetical protein
METNNQNSYQWPRVILILILTPVFLCAYLNRSIGRLSLLEGFIIGPLLVIGLIYWIFVIRFLIIGRKPWFSIPSSNYMLPGIHELGIPNSIQAIFLMALLIVLPAVSCLLIKDSFPHPGIVELVVTIAVTVLTLIFWGAAIHFLVTTAKKRMSGRRNHLSN